MDLVASCILTQSFDDTVAHECFMVGTKKQGCFNRLK